MATTSLSYGVRRTGWGTLRLMRVFRSSLLGLDGLLLLLVLGVAQADHETARQISSELAPAAAAAAQLQASLPRMDADLAEELAAHGTAREAMEARYEGERGLLVHALVQQAGAAADTRGPVEALETGLQHYEQRAQQARDGSAAAATEATGILRMELAPAAQTLAEQDNRALDKSFALQSRRDRMLQISLAIVLAGTLLTLVWAQVLLALRTHRVLHVPLLAAMVCVVAFGIHVGSRLGQETALLDAGARAQLPELRALWHAERLGASVEDLMAQPGGAAGKPVRALAREMETRPAALSEGEIEAALREGREVDGLGGVLAEAVEAAPEPRQRELAITALRQWSAYAAAAGLEGGAKGAASARDVEGLQPFTAALDGAAARSTERLHGALREAMEQSGGTAMEVFLAAVLEGVLVVWGFAARLREYR